jgi:hypothetical protein
VLPPSGTSNAKSDLIIDLRYTGDGSGTITVTPAGQSSQSAHFAPSNNPEDTIKDLEWPHTPLPVQVTMQGSPDGGSGWGGGFNGDTQSLCPADTPSCTFSADATGFSPDWPDGIAQWEEVFDFCLLSDPGCPAQPPQG